MSPQPSRTCAHGAVLATALAVALGAVLAPAASADQGRPNPPRPQPHSHMPAKPEAAEEKPEELRPTPAPVTAYEMPFPCGEVWTGSTRADHSPSPRAVDFNRDGDMGDSVVAAAAGVVIKAVRGEKKPSYGQHVIIDHGNDESTIYAHLDSVSVEVGDTVERGFQLGTVGNTGNSFGAHLHFEERKAGGAVDVWFGGSKFAMGSGTSENCSDAPVGPPPDVPLAGNVVGDDAAELVVFRRTGKPTFRVSRRDRAPKVIKFGGAGDQPLLGDWDGNGRANPAVRNPRSKTFRLKVGREVTEIKFGKRDDLPVAGDWDGLGNWEVGVRRAGTNVFRLRSATGSVTKVALGDDNDLPVTGDWDGDGVTDLGVFDQETANFTLRRVDLDGMEWISTVVFGTPGDLPVSGDWDGDGVTDLGVWTPSTAVFTQRLSDSPTALKAKVRKQQFGRGES